MATTTLSPVDKAADLTLSNGNLTVTKIALNQAPTDIVLADAGAVADWLPSGSVTLTSNSGVWSNFTIRNKIPATHLTLSGSKVRVRFVADPAQQLIISKAYIGERAAAGDDYDFAATPIPLTFNGGSAGATIAAGATLKTDDLVLAFDETKNYVISFHITTAILVRWQSNASVGASYYKAGDDAATVNATGYTTHVASNRIAVDLIEVYGSYDWVTGLTVREDTPIGTALFTISGTDPDLGESATLTFSEVADPDNKFTVSGTTVTLANALNYGVSTSHALTIRATDVHGATYDELFTILVGDV